MINLKIRSIFIFLFFFLLSGCQSAEKAKEESSALSLDNPLKDNVFKEVKRDFKIFDGMMIKDKPDLTKYGLSRINIIYEDSLLTRGKIDQRKIAKELRRIDNTNPICLDIESLEFEDVNYQSHLKVYQTVLDVFKLHHPSNKIGYFGIMPYREAMIFKSNYGASAAQRKNYIAEWDKVNKRIINLANSTHIAFPACYNRTDQNFDYWVNSTELQIATVRKMYPNTPIYAFIWPQYYNKKYINKQEWSKILHKIYELCDGAVIWMPPFNIDNRQTINWNPNVEWWKETIDFIKAKNITSNNYENQR